MTKKASGPKRKSPPPRKKSPKKVNRDVGAQSKGPRLQRLRAALLLLEAKKANPHSRPIIAVELMGDVFRSESDGAGNVTYHEENKNYAPGTNFSFNSDEILNTLTAFCDLWLSQQMSRKVLFGFYTPNGFTKEGQKKNGVRISWPSKPVLELLENKDLDKAKLLSSTLMVFLEYYRTKSQDSDEGEPTGALGIRPLQNYGYLEKWNENDWKSFLQQITWGFGREDERSIESKVIEAIRSVPSFTSDLAGKENLILSNITDLIDRRQSEEDITQRWIQWSDIELIFRDVASGERKPPDSAWRIWETLPKPDDTRNLHDKIRSVCPNFDSGLLRSLTLRATLAIIEQLERSEDRTFLALRARIFTQCDDVLAKLRRAKAFNGIDDSELMEIIEGIQSEAVRKFNDCSLTYGYSIKSESVVKLIVLELFDTCFLSFDEGGSA